MSTKIILLKLVPEKDLKNHKTRTPTIYITNLCFLNYKNITYHFHFIWNLHIKILCEINKSDTDFDGTSRFKNSTKYSFFQ